MADLTTEATEDFTEVAEACWGKEEGIWKAGRKL
jgi:hypothetical protein